MEDHNSGPNLWIGVRITKSSTSFQVLTIQKATVMPKLTLKIWNTLWGKLDLIGNDFAKHLPNIEIPQGPIPIHLVN